MRGLDRSGARSAFLVSDAPAAQSPGAAERGGLRPGRSDPAGADLPPMPRRANTPGATRRLLARLVAARGAMVPTEALLLAVYGGGEGPSDEFGALKVLISKARAGLPRGAIRNHYREGYSLDADVAATMPRAQRDARRLVDLDMVEGRA